MLKLLYQRVEVSSFCISVIRVRKRLSNMHKLSVFALIMYYIQVIMKCISFVIFAVDLNELIKKKINRLTASRLSICMVRLISRTSFNRAEKKLGFFQVCQEQRKKNLCVTKNQKIFSFFKFYQKVITTPVLPKYYELQKKKSPD
jgi:hypothetical protein